MSRLHVFVLYCAGAAQRVVPKGLHRLCCGPKDQEVIWQAWRWTRSGESGLLSGWPIVWPSQRHLLAHELKLTPLFLSNQPRSSGLKESPVFLAYWLQAKVRKSRNIMILNVGLTLFVAMFFNCIRIILNPILKEGMSPIKIFAWKTIQLEPDKLRTHFLSHCNCRAIKI